MLVWLLIIATGPAGMAIFGEFKVGDKAVLCTEVEEEGIHTSTWLIVKKAHLNGGDKLSIQSGSPNDR